MCDGDKLLIIKDRLLTKVAKRNMVDIVPLSYNLQKAKGGLLSWESMYEGMIHAYTGGNIGPISNNITKVWNSDNIGQEQLNVVSWLTFYNNAVIDYAKTLWLPEPPKQVAKIIQSYTKAKVPNFFIYAKNKLAHQVEPENNSTMNRIAAKISESRIKFSKTISKFDYRMLMNLDYDFSISSKSKVVKAYDYWNSRQYLFSIEEEKHQKQEDVYMYQEIRRRILEETGANINYIVNTLVAYLYTIRPNSQKKTLWASFGDVIVENLKRNLNDKGRVCVICGKRFHPKRVDQICCSPTCAVVQDNQNRAKRRSLGQ